MRKAGCGRRARSRPEEEHRHGEERQPTEPHTDERYCPVYTEKREPSKSASADPGPDTPLQHNKNLPPLSVADAVDFMRRIRRGPWYICLADPEKERGDKRAFKTEEIRDADHLGDVIGREGLSKNIYYAVNAWRPGLAKKASKDSVTWAE